MANLSDLLDIGLNEGSDTLQNIANAVTKLPENIQRLVTNPQAFNQLFGYNPMPKETGFAAGATGLPPQAPFGGGILNPKNEGYEEGYQQGEPVAIAAMVAPFAKGKPVGLSIMGPESALWDKEMAFHAGKMEAKGVPASEIFEKTGMARGLDNQWRQEISDKFAKMKGEGNFADTFRRGGLNGIWQKDKVLVKDVLEHPELLEAYPHLGDIQVKTHNAENPVRGAFNQKKNEISIREDLSPEQAKSTMLHELTHSIQAKEEMNRGANAGQLIDYYDKQKQHLMTKIEDLNGQMSEAYKADDMDKYRHLITQRDVLSRRYTNMNPEELGYEDYRHHGGEAEARLVQSRMNLSPEELRKHFPYQYTGERGFGLDINPDEAIITTKHPETINQPSQEYDYRGSHTAPHKSEDNAPGHELDKVFPDDIYGPNAHKYYGHGDTKMDKDTMSIMQSLKGKPEKELKIYRAVPIEHAGEDIYPGDWVTPNLDYAEKHGNRFDNGYQILEKTVPAKHIYTDANSIHEFGYDPTE